MGAVIVGPWDGATIDEVEHADATAESYRQWACLFEELLEVDDGDTVPLTRACAESLAKAYRDREEQRLAAIDRVAGSDEGVLRRKVERLERQLEGKDRGWARFFKLSEQLKRERKGTPLDTLGLDAKTRGHLWAADIVTVEELRKVTARPGRTSRAV
jgi:hypothetical protein